MKNNLSSHIAFAVGIVAILVVVLGTVYYQERIINSGDTVILRTQPIDPRDMFRGEYVILRYEFEQDPRIAEVAKGIADGNQVYVVFALDSEGVAITTRVSNTMPGPTEKYWIAGTVYGGNATFENIGQYYVPEGAGRSIERLGRGLSVEVTLHEGEARVVGLLDAELAPIDVKSHIDRSERDL